MTGRGVDQILPHPVDPAWPWGDALGILDDLAPDCRLINLETSITRGGDFAPGKEVHYRMNPANISCLTVARPDVCALANNHVLDFGPAGLAETLDTLAGAGLRAAGAGRDAAEAGRAAVASIPDRGRVSVVSCGTVSSGIPPQWAAGASRPGVDLLPSLSSQVADQVADRARAGGHPGDIAVISLHWGSNWGYEVGREKLAFPHRLIEGGVDLVPAHSPPHPRPIEVYRGKLILYGCGDFIDDYEGIRGYEEFRDDLRLMFFATVDRGTGCVVGLRIVPLQARRMRLEHATRSDTHLLATILNDISRGYGSRFDRSPDETIDLVTKV